MSESIRCIAAKDIERFLAGYFNRYWNKIFFKPSTKLLLNMVRIFKKQ